MLSYQYPLDICDFWPWPGKVQGPMSVMADAFKSPLVTLEGYGHTVALSGESLCVDQSVVGYLMNPDKPRHDTTCF